MKLKQKTTQKLSTKLISFLPILKADIDELYDELKKQSEDNPFLEIKNKKIVTYSNLKKALSDEIEALSISQKTLFENLIEQIEYSSLFPTQFSKKIAKKIAQDINPLGFFEGDEREIAKELGVEVDRVKKIRERFIYLSPSGVGAKDIKESFLFQLYNLEIDEELFLLVKEMIEKLENLDFFIHHKRYPEALKVIKNFNINPNIEFIPNEEIVPEIIVLESDDGLEIKINDEYYPEIFINENVSDDEYSKMNFKRARSLIDALEMRKSTLKKIALMIVEFQYEFFKGGSIKPMKIQDIAEALEFAPSTISRAISNKFLLCSRGIMPLKSFFSTALDEEVSASEIKEEIKKIIKNEDKNRPLSDEKIVKMINEKYKLNLVRRTITKYRESMQIPSSRERKRLYKLKAF